MSETMKGIMRGIDISDKKNDGSPYKNNGRRGSLKIESDGIVKILTDEGYTKTFIVKEDNSTGSFNVGKVHVPKLFIGKKAFLTVGFEE